VEVGEVGLRSQASEVVAALQRRIQPYLVVEAGEEQQIR